MIRASREAFAGNALSEESFSSSPPWIGRDGGFAVRSAHMSGSVNVPPVGVSAGDFWGGISAAALILPQAMAFGIALWLPVHGDSASAALAGLMTAALLSFFSGLARGSCGMVSAPTGPTLVLLGGAVASFQAQGVESGMLATALLMTLALAGVFQIVIGALNFGAIIKFIPYPVVSGFMTGTGILMILSQENALLPASGVSLAWLPLVTAALTIAAMHYLPRWIGGVPSTVLGLVAGTLFFHGVRLVAGGTIADSWVVGALPSLQTASFGFSWQHFWHLPLTLMALAALALALLASLDTLLTAVIADVATGCRHDARRELMAQGAGHLVASLVGGMAGAGTTGASLVAIESGGRRYSALVVAATIVLVILALAPVAAWLPVSVFSGIIIHVSLFSMLDGEIIQWLRRRRRARLDAAIALVVVAVTVYYDLLAAVALGVVLAVVEFLRVQVGRSTIHRRWSLRERSSMRNRPRNERDAIAAQADQVAGYDLQGALFFGSADSLFATISGAPHRFVILSLRRVTQVDLTALRMIDQISGLLRERGGELVVSHATGRMDLARCKGKRHQEVIPCHAHAVIASFPQTEDAIEYVENLLLRAQGLRPAHDQPRCEPRRAAIFSDFSDKQFSRIAPLLTHHEAKSGSYIFRCGDAGDSLCVMVAGEVEVLLPYRKKRRMRLAVCGPGMEVGEAAFLRPGPRTADLKAISDVVWVELSHAQLLRLADAHPRVAMALVTRLSSELCARLAAADAMLRRLAG